MRMMINRVNLRPNNGGQVPERIAGVLERGPE